MVNPSLLRQLGKEHQREILAAGGPPRAPEARGRVRRRIGWSLIGLGVHLTLPGRPRRSFRPLTRS
ncbi:MAG TPA: hypothetical protein VN816_01815 [Acidimicrobiales bacterium]|nr:hypothetical protein [Acidimicrobiales bacterium]